METRCSRCRWPHCRLIPRFRGVSPSQTPWPCCRWFRARRLAGARANRRCSVTRQRQQRASVEFSFSFFSWGGCGKPFPASLPSSVRWRPVAAHRVRGSAGAPPCAAAVGAAQPVPPPLGPLACAVAVLPAPARLRHRTGEGPAPRRQEQRVPVTLLKKEKHRKSLCKTVAPLPGASPALPWVALPSSRPGLPLVPVLASAGARAPCIEIPVDIGRATAYQVSV